MGRRVERPASCYDQAVKLLARQDSSRSRMRQKLASRDYDDDEIDRTLERLEELGFLDDRRFAQRWAQGRLRRGALGRRRLWAELRQRGVESELAGEVVADLVPEDDLEEARRALESWSRRADADPAALARYLDRLGFTSNAVGQLVAERRDREDNAT